jgi:hypothetical protein
MVERNHCLDHSGNCADLENLKQFQDRQEGKQGVNERVFKTLDNINAKQSWILGGIAAWSIILIVLVTIAAAYLHGK